jgi:hypothetical protein
LDLTLDLTLERASMRTLKPASMPLVPLVPQQLLPALVLVLVLLLLEPGQPHATAEQPVRGRCRRRLDRLELSGMGAVHRVRACRTTGAAADRD